MKSTPYMRDLLLYSGQEDNYQVSSERIKKYLRVSADDSQIHRLCIYYGTLLEDELSSLENSVVEKTTELLEDLETEEVIYAMSDGCLLPTRPHQVETEQIGSWKEMKLGRIFREKDHLNLGEKPNLIRSSVYVSHFGKHHDFTSKLSSIIDPLVKLDERLVFINDGALWIANFIAAYYPNATDILDFYHASEYLHEFSKVIFSEKKEAAQKAQWVDKQTLRFFNDEIKEVIKEIEQLKLNGTTKIKAQEKILTYYKNNQLRMLYKSYKDRGLLIGSGPIESAHRFVLQKRMKQSGQKWTKKGGQAIANIRIFHLNNQWDNVVSLINKHTSNAA